MDEKILASLTHAGGGGSSVVVGLCRCQWRWVLEGAVGSRGAQGSEFFELVMEIRMDTILVGPEIHSYAVCILYDLGNSAFYCPYSSFFFGHRFHVLSFSKEWRSADMVR